MLTPTQLAPGTTHRLTNRFTPPSGPVQIIYRITGTSCYRVAEVGTGSVAQTERHGRRRYALASELSPR